LILLSNQIVDDFNENDIVPCFPCQSQLRLRNFTWRFKIGGLDIEVQRNFFGRQQQSFIANVELNSDKFKALSSSIGVFIRAPSIAFIDTDKVCVLAKLDPPSGGPPMAVAVEEDKYDILADFY